MTTAQSQPSDQFSHSNLVKVVQFCQYIADNWTLETRLCLWSLGFCEDILTFSFEAPTGMFDVEVNIADVNSGSIGDTVVSIYEANLQGDLVETISLRHIAGNY